MLRRPPTSIELKLDDIQEYEEMRQQLAKEKANKSSGFDLPSWMPGPKSKEEVYKRIGIGYAPERQAQNRDHFFNYPN